MSAYTYLCPDCDGYGYTGGERLDVDDYADEYPCMSCNESGVVHLSREIGEQRNLQPWHGEVGRSAARVRIRRIEWLVELARCRKVGARGRSVAYADAKRRALDKSPGFVEYYFAEAGIRFMATARLLGYLEAA